MGVRAMVGVAVVLLVNAASRLSRRGSGTVAGGRAGLAVDPRLLAKLAQSRHMALVSGTNGKTTTTALLSAALGSTGRRVASNATGSNMPAGHVAALVGGRGAPTGCLEVDEAYLASSIRKPGESIVLGFDDMMPPGDDIKDEEVDEMVEAIKTFK